jgi:endoglucanase
MCRFAGGLIYKSNASNMQSTTSMSFLALAYAKYLSDVYKVARCANVEATPARLRAFAKRQVGTAVVFLRNDE